MPVNRSWNTIDRMIRNGLFYACFGALGLFLERRFGDTNGYGPDSLRVTIVLFCCGALVLIGCGMLIAGLIRKMRDQPDSDRSANS